MKNIVIFLLFAGIILCSCTKTADQNAFFSEWDTPFQTPPFNKIKDEHFLPALKEGLKQEKEEIDAIVNNSEEPTFENTIAALEETGGLLKKVDYVLSNLNSANTNENLQQISKEFAPLKSKHEDEIKMNMQLFERIQTVYKQKESLDLTPEQITLLEKYYKDFVRGGANLNDQDKEKLKAINEELSVLSLQFGENVLKENNKFELHITDEKDLDGLTEASVSAAREAAQERGYENGWVFTLHKPSLIPFLRYAENRSLREKMYKGYIMRGDNNDELDNKKILSRMAGLRVEKAKLLGYDTHAHYVLDKNMAQKPEAVYELLQQLWTPALKMAKNEVRELQDLIYKDGNDFKLQPWDWWYYAEKLKKTKYALDDAVLRPYFKLENVRNGAFAVAGKLFGIQFEERPDIPVYNPDVKVFEVKESDGSHIGILYVDYFPRASKRGGAWMSAYREQYKKDGKNIKPIITNVCNFSKPTGDKPALLSLGEVETLFHEFGHALHGLLSDCTYPSLSGTDVPRDFVELPSQIMENWATAPEVLRLYAKHYQTGETIHDELIEKIQNASLFNQGFATTEYLAASFLDMDWHTLDSAHEMDPIKFEAVSLEKIGLIPEIESRYRSTYFRHIFAGGYSSGYYSYIWAEVLDADAFRAFKEKGLFDQKTAQSFRNNILAAGGTEDAMVLYKRFRGTEPDINALLEKRGLK